MSWKTSISKINEGKEFVRGEALEELIKEKSFAEVVYLIWKGKFPNKEETSMMNALLVSCIDHGIGAPSATVSRIAASAGNSMHTALSAGISTLGELHGGAIEGAAEFFEKNIRESNISEVLKSMKDKGQRVPGYGHKVLKEDMRARALFVIAKGNGFFGDYCKLANKVESELEKISSKKLPLNIDGAMAAIILEMGFRPGIAKGFFMTGRVPGLLAHIYEQQNSGEGLKRISEDEITYISESK